MLRQAFSAWVKSKPALSLPLPGGLGLQLVGAPGSDLRLLELGQILASVADTGE